MGVDEFMPIVVFGGLAVAALLFFGGMALLSGQNRAKTRVPLANLLIPANPQKVRDTLILQMLNRGTVLVEDSPNRLVFESLGTEVGSLVSSMIMGEYVPKDRRRYTFIFVSTIEGMSVTANADILSQSEYGHPRTSRNNGPFLIRWLDELNSACIA